LRVVFAIGCALICVSASKYAALPPILFGTIEHAAIRADAVSTTIIGNRVIIYSSFQIWQMRPISGKTATSLYCSVRAMQSTWSSRTGAKNMADKESARPGINHGIVANADFLI
jgi:hypothetical protein